MTANTHTDLPSSFDDVFPQPTREKWVERTVAGLKSDMSDVDALKAIRRTTLEGIPFEVLYDDAKNTGNTASGSLNTALDNRLYVCGSDPAQASKKIMQGLSGGITSLELHTRSPAHIASLLNEVQLDIAHVSLRSGNAYDTCAQALRNLSSDQLIEDSAMSFSVNADPISTTLALGESRDILAAALKDAAQFTVVAASELPNVHCILADSAVHHNAGASTVEELHAVIATATLYLETLLETGMSSHDASAQIVFQVAVDADVLLGVAKLRALRALWHHVVNQLGAGNSQPVSTLIVAETSRRFHSRLEPWNNHLRNLCASSAAIVGGADSLMVHPHDTLLRSDNTFDTQLGDRMARNMAIILERECGLTTVNDPMAGSYAIENLTQQLMQHTWESLSSTDTAEGWIDELLSGRWQTRLQTTHRQRVTLMEQEQRVAVGVNRYVQSGDTGATSSNTAPTDAFTTTAKPSTGETSAAEYAVKPALTPVREAESFEQNTAQEMSS